MNKHILPNEISPSKKKLSTHSTKFKYGSSNLRSIMRRRIFVLNIDEEYSCQLGKKSHTWKRRRDK